MYQFWTFAMYSDRKSRSSSADSIPRVYIIVVIARQRVVASAADAMTGKRHRENIWRDGLKRKAWKAHVESVFVPFAKCTVWTSDHSTTCFL